jgi:tetratricopeptide (TPR) repeat protein
MPKRRAVRSHARAKLPPSQPSEAAKIQAKRRPQTSRRRWLWTLAALGGLAVVCGTIWLRFWAAGSPGQLQSQAETAARAGDWTAALAYWRALNATKSASSATHLSEARVCLALGRAAQAERSLHRAIAANPSDVTPWQLLLKIFRIEDRALEAEQTGWKAYTSVHPDARPELLRELTLSLLADLPDDTLRTTLKRWVEADPADVDAEVAFWQRIAVAPRADDPDRPTLLATLAFLLSSHPNHTGTREALVATLADTGEPERGRALLDTWPEATRDARYWRLRGRWNLEYDRQPEQAVTAFQSALRTFPQDWRTWYRLSRALHALGRDDEGRRAAESVSRIREVLDPLTLGPRLDVAVNHLDDPASLQDLASLCQRAGLERLADAWRALAQKPVTHPNAEPAVQQPGLENPRHGN